MSVDKWPWRRLSVPVSRVLSKREAEVRRWAIAEARAICRAKAEAVDRRFLPPRETPP